MIKYAKFVFITFVGAAIYYAHSVHSEYYQGVRAVESYKYAKHVAASAVKHFSTNMVYPSHINELNLRDSDASYVGNLSIDKSSGVISIYLAGDSLDEGMFVFTPSANNNGSVDYACHSVDVPVAYVPNDCSTKGDLSGPASPPANNGSG